MSVNEGMKSFSKFLCDDEFGEELYKIWNFKTLNFSNCFTNTIIQFISFIYILIFGFIYYFFYIRLNRNVESKKFLIVDKLRCTLSVLLCLLPVIALMFKTHFFSFYIRDFRHEIIASLIIFFTMLLATSLQIFEVRKGLGQSSILRFFWCFFLVTRILKFLNFIKEHKYFTTNVFDIFFCFLNIVDFFALLFVSGIYLFVSFNKNKEILNDEKVEELGNLLISNKENKEAEKQKDADKFLSKKKSCTSVSTPVELDSNFISCFASPSFASKDVAIRVNPELNCGVFAYLSFSWVSPIIAKGKNDKLTEDDLFDLIPQEKAGALASRVLSFCEAYKRKASRNARHDNSEESLIHVNNACSTVISEEANVYYGKKEPSSFDESKKKLHFDENERNDLKRNKISMNLACIFGLAFWKTFLVAGLLKFVYDLLLFGGPLLLKEIINFLKTPVKEASLLNGLLYVMILFLLNIAQSLILHQYFHRQFRLGFCIRSAATSLIYHKSLKIYPEMKVPSKEELKNRKSKKKTNNNENTTLGSSKFVSASSESNHTYDNKNNISDSRGEVINFMSVDCQRLQDLMVYIHIIWSAPLQISIALYLLYSNIGISALAGVGVVIVSLVFTGFIANLVKYFQSRVMRAKDKRIKICSEVLNGIKIIKLYTWETPFFYKITEIRSNELKIFWRYQLAIVSSRVLWNAVPALIAIFSFLTYNLLGNEMDAAVVFTALSLFNILRFPLQLLPYTINNVMEAYLSIRRIQAYLEAPELPLFQPPFPPTEEAPTCGELEEESLENCQKKKVVLMKSLFVSQKSKNPANTKNCVIPSENKTAEQQTATPNSDIAISVKNATLVWPNGDVVFENISFKCHQGELTIIAGRTGSGKTALLLSLIGDLPVANRVEAAEEAGEGTRESGADGAARRPRSGDSGDHSTFGNVRVRGKIAYASQNPWIQNLSLRDNICFGEKYDKDWYDTVIKSCTLDKDIGSLPDSDMTIIGERGITLSGGQKQRIALARAVYNKSKNIYLLDDIFSAVDSHVMNHIIHNCLLKLLKDKTVVIVTHNHDVFPLAQQIIFVENKKILFTGKYENLQNTQEFISFSADTIKKQSALEEKHNSKEDKGKYLLETEEINFLEQSKCGILSLKDKKGSLSEGVCLLKDNYGITTAKKEEKKLQEGAHMEKEFLQQGKVSAKVYWSFIKGAGGFLVILSIVSLIFAHQTTQIFSNAFLSYWTDSAQNLDTIKSLHIYMSINVLQIFLCLCCYLSVAVATQNASRAFHRALTVGILRAPMAFFETTPVGRIINRFAKDIYVIDEQLSSSLMVYISFLFQVAGTFIIISYILPGFVILLLPIAAFYCCVQNYYIPSSRQLQRIESALRSPIFSHFGETLDGCATIRAFNEQHRFILMHQNRLDENIRAYYLSVSANRWLALRLEFVGTCVVTVTSFLSVMAVGYLTPGLCGLAIAYSLNISQTLNWLVRMASDTETNIVAVERVNEYSDGLAQEDTIMDDSIRLSSLQVISPPADWPNEGLIEFKNYSLKYRPELPYVLTNLNIVIRPKEHVGIVGRTGAGKSSILLSLMRMVEHSEGKIFIDNIDIKEVQITKLRSIFSVIPQDPVLFSGTVRSNIDPFNNFSDDEVWRALERTKLKKFILSLSKKNYQRVKDDCSSADMNKVNKNEVEEEKDVLIGGDRSNEDELSEEYLKQKQNALFYEVQEGGKDFSMGEKQLICLARALIRESRILLLDEATSMVDPLTDQIIQTVIRTEFADSTILCIAHRLNTILDYDKIIFMSDGSVKEFDSPANLLKDENSLFRELVLQSWSSSKNLKRNI